jgi:aryl-alcohol dehydrogenase-like predicted oxidoreductase
MMSPDLPTFSLGATACPRLIRGAWQLAGGHGPVDRARAITDALAYARAGFLAFDCADIYTGVEELLGETRRRWQDEHPDAPPLRIHTKCVPDLSALPTLRPADIRALVERSRARLGQDALDLVQFHWWDFAVPGFEAALDALETCRRDGLVRQVGLTNTDGARLREVLERGVPVVSNQVQVSLLDRRALRDLSPWCGAAGVSLLAYGTLAGGFFHERWHGAADPAPAFENRSLVKYRLVIDECGGWSAFQDLLDALARIAARHQASIGQVAVAWVLAQPAVGAAIVGARDTTHLDATARIPQLALTATDLADIAQWTTAHPGPQGPVYALERNRTGPHGSIMRYNLNRP